MPKQHVQLTPTDRDTLTALITNHQRRPKSPNLQNAPWACLNLTEAKTYTQVAKTLGMTGQTLSNWAKKYRTLGLDGLKDAPRPGTSGGDGPASNGPKSPPWPVQPPRQAMADGRCASWADHCVALGSCEHLSHTHVKTSLKKNELKPHLKKTWCIRKVDASLSRTHGSLALAV